MAAEAKLTFAEHVSELRRRLMWSSLFVLVGAGIGYAMHDTLLVILQQPLSETLYYTTPTGAFGFIIKVCTVFGLIMALPALTYNGFAYFEPLIKAGTRRLLIGYVFISVLLAAAGILFAYFVSLPAALHFLINFGGGGIEAIITANEYFNFVLAYLAGFALLFELPLILAFINRIKPLTPSKLIGGTRYVILGSFIAAAIITPTPDPMNQLLMAGPVILLYFVSAAAIVASNRLRRKPSPQAVVSQPTPLQSAFSEAPATTPAPAAPRPVRPTAQTARINDMAVPNRRATVSAYQQRPPRSDPPQRQKPQTRLISDFLPSAD